MFSIWTNCELVAKGDEVYLLFIRRNFKLHFHCKRTNLLKKHTHAMYAWLVFLWWLELCQSDKDRIGSDRTGESIENDHVQTHALSNWERSCSYLHSQSISLQSLSNCSIVFKDAIRTSLLCKVLWISISKVISEILFLLCRLAFVASMDEISFKMADMAICFRFTTNLWRETFNFFH